MSKIIGNPSAKSVLDEMIETTREANAEFLAEIEKEKQEAERKTSEPAKITEAEKPLEEKAKAPEAVAPSPVKPDKRDTPGYALVYAGTFMLGAFAIVYAPIRIYAEYDEKTDYRAECVFAVRAVGFWGYRTKLMACNNSRTITALNRDGEEKYKMTDSNSDGLVDVLEEKGTLYKRPHSRIDEAQENWKEDWEALGADEILKGWEEWKARQR